MRIDLSMFASAWAMAWFLRFSDSSATAFISARRDGVS
jgi:hypothetical protein